MPVSLTAQARRRIGIADGRAAERSRILAIMDDPRVIEELAGVMWTPDHDGTWPKDAEDLTAKIYRENARAVIAALKAKIGEGG